MSDILSSELHREAIRMHLNRSVEGALNQEPCCAFWGEGISQGVQQGSVAKFYVRTKTPDLLLFTIAVMDPDFQSVDVDFHCVEENMHLLSFNVAKTGNYVLDVEWEGKPVNGSPFTVMAS